LAPGLVVQRGVAPVHWRPENVKRFRWRGEPIAISGPLPAALSRQIIAQARHDPAVLAAGAASVRFLRWHEARDLCARDGVNVSKLFAEIPVRPRIVVIVSALRGDRADLIDATELAEGGPLLVLVTKQTAVDADFSQDYLAGHPDLSVVFWRDACGGPGHANPRIVANFLHAVRPKTIVAIDSEFGRDTLSRHGRGLAQNARLLCDGVTDGWGLAPASAKMCGVS
jgi:hypothetical protein